MTHLRTISYSVEKNIITKKNSYISVMLQLPCMVTV